MINAIETSGLTREYAPGVGAVDVDLAVPTGTVYGFLGPNGAGKSTTIRMLVGMTRPDRGTASVLGLDPVTETVALKRRIGVLSAESAIPRHHTARSLLRLLASLRGDDSVVERGVSLAERLELELDRPGHELSLGNRQKVGLVAALAHDPELVVLDEPSNGLDPLLQRELDGLLRELTQRGRTVLLSSHSLSEVERIAEHVGFIRGAKLVEQATLTELAARAVRVATVRFERAVPADAFEEVRGVIAATYTDERHTVTLSWQGPVAPLLLRAGALGATSIDARGADLEATFLAMYRRDDA